MDYQFIRTEVKGRIGYITLNRPEKRNALNYEFVSELKKAFTAFGTTDEVKIIVLKANGNVFSAGADLSYLQQLQTNSYEENLEDSGHLKDLFYQIYTHDKIIIAQIEGHAIAGGCGLATVCDFCFSTEEALFGYTEVKIGFIPAIVLVFLIRKIGEAKAKELLLTGKLIKSSEALKVNLINEIVDKKIIGDFVKNFADNLCKEASGESLKLTKTMIGQVQEKTLEQALSYAAEMNAQARSTIDCKKGIHSFLAKEKLVW